MYRIFGQVTAKKSAPAHNREYMAINTDTNAQKNGTGSPLPGSAIPRVRHSHGRTLGRVRVRVRFKVRVRVRLRLRVRG